MMCISTDLPLAAGHGDVDETASVSEPLLGAALGGLLLLLGLNLFQRVSLCTVLSSNSAFATSCATGAFVVRIVKSSRCRGGRACIQKEYRLTLAAIC
jgi:hypothetical protein